MELSGTDLNCPMLFTNYINSSWLLNTVDKLNLTKPPALAIFPLGTGNDLARALGYGSGSDASADIEQFLTKLGSYSTHKNEIHIFMEL